ncbi:hypothetical protein IQ274_33940 [Nostoc sp. LEGE 12447]|uniref:hypothetical protein n=1 Tax=Nostoc sp. LEGE 12447 TaxID=1828640 RepID=UPI0018843527|nr:hypothetical protein [Nostoc sp. LEGE 12447]MBE9003042.1 hypothetical protein [Nostoc sp. LEGE 12447]
MQPPAPERKKGLHYLNFDSTIQSDCLRSNRGTGTTREGEGYTAGNGFALNKKLPTGRRAAVEAFEVIHVA